MTTEQKPENTSETTEVNQPENPKADNKAIFGPLGKYAAVAVIMVSIIVTTAIMLDKELNTVEEKLAVIEDEVVEMVIADADEITAESKTAITVATKETAAKANVAVEAPVDTASTPVETVAVVETHSAEVLVAAPAPVEAAATQTAAITATQTETATTESAIDLSAQDRHAAMAKDNQARIEAFKAEQKQRMTEMFARIKTLEAERLDQYKTRQDEQVERLREQIAKQQELIDELISRNKERYDTRAASVEKNQSKREEMLNRI